MGASQRGSFSGGCGRANEQSDAGGVAGNRGAVPRDAFLVTEAVLRDVSRLTSLWSRYGVTLPKSIKSAVLASISVNV